MDWTRESKSVEQQRDYRDFISPRAEVMLRALGCLECLQKGKARRAAASVLTFCLPSGIVN